MNLNSLLLPYQQAWVADRAKLRVAAKARRIGLTWAEAARQVFTAARSKAQGGCNCYYVSTSARLGREYIATCAKWVRAFNQGGRLVADEARDILAGEIRFNSGFVIKALPSNPEAMRGLGGSIIIDEAGFHDDLGELLKAAYACGDWGGDLAVISTFNGLDEFYELVEEVQSCKRADASLHRIDIMRALEDGLHRRRCAMEKRPYTPESQHAWLARCLASPGAEEEYLCIPRRSGGSYIRRDLVDECMTLDPQVVRWELPPEAAQARRSDSERTATVHRWAASHLSPLIAKLEVNRPITLGYDFARSHNGDLSVIAPMLEKRSLVKSVPWLLEMRGVPFDEQWALLQWLVSQLQTGQRRFTGLAVDSGGNGGFIGEKALQRWGSTLVDAVQLSEQWYASNMPRFRAAFEEHLIELTRDSDVRDDILMISKNPRGVPKLSDARRKDETGKPRHGDAAIALVLAHSRHRGDAPTSDYRSISRRSA